jgi:hypothetical protein
VQHPSRRMPTLVFTSGRSLPLASAILASPVS